MQMTICSADNIAATSLILLALPKRLGDRVVHPDRSRDRLCTHTCIQILLTQCCPSAHHHRIQKINL